MTDSIEQRLDYLEESNEALKMQNRVLATAFKGMLRALPPDVAGDVIESIQIKQIFHSLTDLFTFR